jgi:hypothetical protein
MVTEFLPDVVTVIAFVMGILIGATAPTYYAQERLRGFGRSMFKRLPYEPPPTAESEQEALEDATENESDD